MMKMLCLALYLISFPTWSKVSLDQAQELFERVVATESGSIQLELSINHQEAKKPGAFAKWDRPGKSGIITLTQSLLDLEVLNLETLSVFLCHELGHFYGGAPFIKSKPTTGSIFSFKNPFINMSVEGQADYYATQSCLPKLFFHTKLTDLEIYEEILSRIESTTKIYDLIGRDYYNIHEDWSFDNYDPSKVSQTIQEAGKYPSLQCRFDTMRIGLSNVSAPEAEMISRPTCWYQSN